MRTGAAGWAAGAGGAHSVAVRLCREAAFRFPVRDQAAVGVRVGAVARTFTSAMRIQAAGCNLGPGLHRPTGVGVLRSL